MAFNRGALSSATPDMPHTGYMIPELLGAGVKIRAKVMDGNYFDCGTPREYLNMLQLVS
jgi:UTP-glucose-1-phosphate uridylyltransferase